jgi:lipoprotein-anchoring transpeptidase ErfK/SrfK
MQTTRMTSRSADHLSRPTGGLRAWRSISRFATGACVVGLLVAGLATSSGAAIRPAATKTAPPVSGSKVPSIVAEAKGSIVSIFATPTSRDPYQILDSPTAEAAPLVFLVSDTKQFPTWLRVYLPNRPNGSQGWIHASAVTLTADDYLVHVQLKAHVLTVFMGTNKVMSTPIGEGRSVLPTPTGTYYIIDLLRQPDPTGAYGPFAFGTSAYSDVLTSFGGGPGEIGIHGTDEPSSVGESVSHGCIRVEDATITRLAGLLPLGTPVIITA